MDLLPDCVLQADRLASFSNHLRRWPWAPATFDGGDWREHREDEAGTGKTDAGETQNHFFGV